MRKVRGGRNRCRKRKSVSGSWKIIYRLKKGSDGYVWVKNNLSLIENEGGERRVYAMYQDMTKEREEQEKLRRQYQDMLMQHYHTHGADTLVLGHCNVTQNRILEISDYTGSGLLDTFGAVRDEFFTGIGGFIVDEKERRQFHERYLNKPSLEAFERGETEQKMECFIKLPEESKGRYVQIKMNLVSTPDSGDVTVSCRRDTARDVSGRAALQVYRERYRSRDVRGISHAHIRPVRPERRHGAHRGNRAGTEHHERTRGPHGGRDLCGQLTGQR